MKKTLFISALILMGSTCLVSAANAGGWKRSSVQYDVPVSDELKPYATFEIKDVKSRTRDGVQEIRYDLPLELTGAKNTVHLRSIGNDRFAAPNAEALCTLDTCTITYKDLAIDATAAANLISARSATPNELESRIKVFERFSGDPVGVIRRQPNR